MNRVRCLGYETSVVRCQHSATSPASCQHANDVAIDCTGDYVHGPTPPPGRTPAPGYQFGTRLNLTAELRSGITTTSTSTAGVLVLGLDGSFATVFFDVFWTRKNSRVACRMLGFNMSTAIPLTISPSFFSYRPNIPILPMYLDCQGDEEDLSLCDRMSFDATIYPISTYLAIDCIGGNNLQMSLVPASAKTGQLIVTYNDRTGSSCTFTRSPRHISKVYCRMLGYSDHEGAVVNARPTENQLPNGTSAMISGNITCQGYEKNIAECMHVQPFGVAHCFRNQVATISCVPQGHVNVRLTGGNSTYGRLEVHYEGQWGTVCDDWFEDAGAKVFCRMLKLPYVWHTLFNS